MGILGKLMFWKHKDEFSDIGLGDKEKLAFGDDFPTGNQQLGLGPEAPAGPAPSFPSTPAQSFQSPQYQPPRFDNPQQDINSKSLEVISSKIDALRASMDSLNQRLANLEAIAKGEEEKSRRRYY